ncbi:MauE/DoxX family redox-associated membrane protein [Devosia sp.]|uniref:MauE/DoxX family redox-associated membrane protein n=1 Tax=Devosia sp. TaxID=1871048 RepID=UPI0019E174D6|nr:MauE/DoxX family redox-associated membrane protein [Devosia sp.]MBE0579562.1 methylamine utilization protein MauE [Devosia sp.]
MSAVTLSSMLTATVTVFLCLLFARAAWHKIAEFTEFTGFVADYRLVPEALVRPVSMSVVVAEILVVLLQLVPGGQVFGLVLAMAILGLYVAAMSINILRGRTSIECGCGGAVQPLSWSLVWRNAVLITMAITAVATAPYSLDAGSAIAALASGFTLWTGFLLAEQILANDATARLTR